MNNINQEIKKHVILTFCLSGLCALLSACQPLGQGSQQPSPMPRATEIPQVLYNNYPDLTPTPYPSITPYQTPPPYPPTEAPPGYEEIKIMQDDGLNHYYCEPPLQSNILRYPTEVAVSPDGQNIYASDAACQTYPNKLIWKNICHFDSQQKGNILKRKSVYHIISRNTAESILNNSQHQLSCFMGNELEIDGFQQLYFVNNYTRQIIQRNPYGKENTLLTINELSNAHSLAIGVPKEKLSAPSNFQIQKNKLLFDMSAHSTFSDYQLRNIDLMSLQVSQLYSSFSTVSKPSDGFAFWQEQIYFLALNTGANVSSKENQLLALTNTKTSAELRSISLTRSDQDEISPHQIRAASADLFYLSDVKNHQIWVIRLNPDHSEGSLTVLAGSGQKGYQDGQGTAASFYVPTALSLDGAGNLYVADTGNHAIRKITPDGMVSTVYKAPEG